MDLHSDIIAYLGILVSGLAVLVTLLIGWNIYSVLDLKKRVSRELRKYKRSIRRDLIEHKSLIDGDLLNINEKITQDVYLKTNLITGTSLMSIGKAMLDVMHIPSAMWFYLMGARQLQGVDDEAFEHSFTQFKQCLDILANSKDYEMSTTIKDSCLSALREIDGNDINDLIILLINIPSISEDKDLD